MYVPRHFEETRVDVMHALIDAHPLGALVRAAEQGLDADHIPFDIAPPTSEAPLGMLRAHVARANPLWREGGEVMVLFQGPSAYIPAEFYEQKTQTGKVVPTWNYAVVHAHGRMRAIEDAQWLLALVQRLTDRHEASRPAPWKVKNAPSDYIDRMLKAIVGIEIPITRLSGKWKLEQDCSRQDQARIIAGLGARPASAPLAQLMQQRLQD